MILRSGGPGPIVSYVETEPWERSLGPRCRPPEGSGGGEGFSGRAPPVGFPRGRILLSSRTRACRRGARGDPSMAGEARDRPPPRSIRTSGSRPAPGRSRWTGRNCGSSSSGELTSQRTRSAGKRLQSRRHQVALPAIGQPPVPGAGGRRRRLAHGLEVVGRPVAKGSAVPDGRPSARRVHRPAGGFRIPLSVFDFHERYPLSAETGGGHSIVVGSRSVRGSRKPSLHPTLAGAPEAPPLPRRLPPKPRPNHACARDSHAPSLGEVNSSGNNDWTQSGGDRPPVRVSCAAATPIGSKP